jgi:D-inositol-3-phosphate glycosyltransferase
MEDLVLFLGKRAQETLPYYYSAADMLIMPSYYESFGMVALEAMACGTPVIVSQVGGLPYLVQDGKTGFVVPSGGPEVLVDPLNQLMNDNELRERMGNQAAAYAKGYSWELIAKKINKVYQELLRNSEQK